jgi:phenylacetate-coenzyme A ligase PaaK-like adenylate-forming protein
LAEQNISNDQFKKDLKKKFGINNTFNYYGMVEQVGSIFMECEKGYLHCPDFADIIVRDPNNLEVLDNGREGVVQVLSILPLSYPGHSLLTEDLGTIHGEDDCECGRKGKFFTISGRMPMAELRGCSDTRVA